MTLLSIADSSRKTNSAIKGSSSFYPNPENLLEGRIKVLFRFTFFPASLESVMTDTKWPCKMSKNIWRNKLIIVVTIYSFFSFGCLFVSRKIKKIAFTPLQQKAENSRTVEKWCYLMSTWRWIHQHSVCAVRLIIQFGRKNLILAAKWCSKFLN